MSFVLKILGIGFIIGGSILFGRRYNIYRARRVLILESIQKTICMMREKILRENALLEVCMASCGQMYPIPEGNLFESFARVLEQGKSPESCWGEFVKAYLEQNNLYNESLYTGLAELRHAFAQMNTDSLVASLDTVCAFLEKEVDLEKEKSAKEGPLYQKISLALGVLLCVILY